MSRIFPDEITREILSYKDPCELMKFLENHQELRYLFEEKGAIHNLAIDYGLPYFENITLCNLCYYQAMEKTDLLILSSRIGDLRVVNFLLQPHKIIEYGFQLSDYTKSLKEAVKNDNIEIVKKLISNVSRGMLHWFLYDASKLGNIEMVKLLLDSGAGNIPASLDTAVINQHPNVVKLLLEKVHEQKFLICAFEHALTKDNREIVDMIHEKMSVVG